MGKLIETDKDDLIDYTFDFGAWLATGETISDKTVTPTGTVTASAGTVVTGSKSVAGVATAVPSGAVTVRASAIADGSFTCHIVTSTGQTADRTIDLRVVVR